MKALKNIAAFSSDPVGLLDKLAMSGPAYGGIHFFPMAHKRFVSVFEPDAIAEMLIKRPDIYLQNRVIFNRIQPVTGRRGLVQLNGAESKIARKKTRPLFNNQGLRQAQSAIERFTDEWLERTPPGKIALIDEVFQLILRTAFQIFLGVDIRDDRHGVAPMFVELNNLCGSRMRAMLPAPLLVPTQCNRRIVKLRCELRATVAEILSKDAIIAQIYGQSDELIDHALTFLFAGHETTASSLIFTLQLLAQNPEYQDWILASEAHTEAVYKESLRLYPPAYMLAREARQEDLLMGRDIARGDQVLIGVRQVHRHPGLFERPDAFHPERFLSPLGHRFAFIPFGVGPKSCVGERLAYLEANIVLRKICSKFRLEMNNDPIQSAAHITLHPEGNPVLTLNERGVRHVGLR